MPLISPYTLALTYPGQGALTPGLLARLAEHSSQARGIIEQIRAGWTESTGDDLGGAELDERPATVGDDRAFARSQLAIFATSMGLHEVLRPALTADVVHVGHSLGEITALTAAGAWSPADATRVVAARTTALAAVARGSGGMTAMTGGRAQVEHLLAALADPDLVVSGQNGPDQVVVSGPIAALTRLETASAALGLTAIRLRADFPFHSPLMAPAKAAFAAAVRAIGWQDPLQPVYSPISGRFYRPGEDLAEELASQLVTAFDFGTAVRTLRAQGITLFIECGAQGALTAAVRRTLGASAASEPWRAVACDDKGTAQPAVHAIDAIADLRHQGAAPDALTPGADLAAVTEFLRKEFSAFTQRLFAELGRLGTSAEPPPPAPPVLAEVPAVLAEVPAAATAPVAAAATASTTPVAADPDLVMAELVDLYATALEYPPEVLESDIELEGDLGVDSVKQTELLARAADHFKLPPQPAAFVIGDYPTLGHIAKLVLSSAGGHR